MKHLWIEAYYCTFFNPNLLKKAKINEFILVLGSSKAKIQFFQINNH